MTNPVTSEFCWLLGKLKNPATGESLGEFKKARPWGQGRGGRDEATGLRSHSAPDTAGLFQLDDRPVSSDDSTFKNDSSSY